MIDKYTEWINIINTQCNDIESDVKEDDFFKTVFKDSQKYCYV